MKTFAKKLLAVGLIGCMLWLAACEKNPTASKSQKPDLPPQSSMVVDLNVFNNAAQLSNAGADQTNAGLNFIAARLTVGAINLAVFAHMSVPVLTFAAALSQEPALKDDGKWHWVYSVSNASGQQFQADLAGWIDESAQVSRWEMRMSTTGLGAPLNNFLWYTGQASRNNGSGQWDIYDAAQPSNSVKVVHIDWDHPSTANATLKFTVVKPQVPENGDVLTYKAENSSRSVTYFDQSANSTLQIFWDEVTHAGYIIAPNYNNGQKSCWDSQLNDTTCQ
jgi:hypothetical protein